MEEKTATKSSVDGVAKAYSSQQWKVPRHRYRPSSTGLATNSSNTNGQPGNGGINTPGNHSNNPPANHRHSNSAPGHHGNNAPGNAPVNHSNNAPGTAPGNHSNSAPRNHGNDNKPIGQASPKPDKEAVSCGPDGQKRPKTPTTSRTQTNQTQRLTPVKEPTFYIGGGNGALLIEEFLTDLGWKRITDKRNENYKLRWVENNCMINFSAFKEGEQLVNRIPNCHLLTNKLGLLQSLQRYERVLASISPSRGPFIRASEFLPETYRLDDLNDRKQFFDTYKEGEIWISKPTGLNQGRGIYLVRNLEELRKSLEDSDEKQRRSHRRGAERIIQRYITNPLLLNGRKFDIRAFMLIASTTPYLLLYQRGYIRLSLYNYSNTEENLTAHLTNQFIQKKDASYDELKEETVWSMEKFNDYINQEVAPKKGLERDWVHTTLYPRMKNIISYCFKAVKHKLKRKVGFFDLYGLDFMIDESMKIWLIEVNVNPCLAINCQGLKEVVPDVVHETLHVAIECFEKSRKRQPLFPLRSLKNFQILYSESGRGHRSTPSPRRVSPSPQGGALNTRSLSPISRSLSLSPKGQQTQPPKEPPSPPPLTLSERFTRSSRIYSPKRQTLTPRSPTFGILSQPKQSQEPPLNNAVLGSSSCGQIKFRMSHASLKQKRLLTLSQVSSRRELMRSRTGVTSGQGQRDNEGQGQGHRRDKTEESTLQTKQNETQAGNKVVDSKTTGHGQRDIEGQSQGQSQGQRRDKTKESTLRTKQTETQAGNKVIDSKTTTETELVEPASAAPKTEGTSLDDNSEKTRCSVPVTSSDDLPTRSTRDSIEARGN